MHESTIKAFQSSQFLVSELKDAHTNSTGLAERVLFSQLIEQATKIVNVLAMLDDRPDSGV